MSVPSRPTFLRDSRGFTGAEKALLICFALAVVALIGALVSRGGEKAAGDAKRTLMEQGGSLAKLGEAVRPIQAAGDPGGSGGGTSPGGPGGGNPGPSAGDPGSPGAGTGGGDPASGGGAEDKKTWKAGGTGSGKTFDNSKTTSGSKSWKGAPEQSAEDKAKAEKKKGSKTDVEVGIEKQLFEKKGALAEKEWKTGDGGSEKVSGGYGKVEGTAGAKASWKEGASAGAKVEGKASALNWQGKHNLPGGIEEKHEVDVLSVKGSLGGKAGISKDVIGATVSGEAGANLAEGKISGSKTFKIPFTNLGVEIGGQGSASAGANIGGEASGGYFKGDDGKRRFGFKAGFKAALGLGLGGKLSLNLVW